MKTFIRISTVALAVFFISLSGCDYISEPFQYREPIDTTEIDSNVYKNVLIDDFTGHKCVNCPEAAEMVEFMKSTPFFTGEVIAISIHTGFFAKPFNTPFDNDWTTTEGDDLNSKFGPSSFPIGMVNRIDYPNNHLKNYQSWPGDAVAFDSVLADIDIQPMVSYDTTSRKAMVDVKLEYLSTLNGDYNIVVLVAESHIIAAQTSHSGDILDYEHNHMLRGSSNTIIGEEASRGQIDAGTEINYNTSVTLDASWVDTNCDLIIYVYDIANEEIIQVVETAVN